MHDYRNSVKITLILTYIALALLLIFTVTMPFLVQWFVEVRHKDPTLATSIMITCYPCVPFAVGLFWSLRCFLKNVLSGLVLGDKNIKLLKIMAICCFFAAVIMIAGGFRYMPFWISGGAALVGALVITTFRNIFDSILQMQREEDFRSVRMFYEKDDNIGNR